jgi:hypothetical protein
VPANRDIGNGLENRYPSSGGSRVRIPPPPLTKRVPASEPASRMIVHGFPTAALRPWKSVEVQRSPLAARTAGARLAHSRAAARSLR